MTGNGIVIILCLLQPHYYKFMTKLEGLIRLTVFDLVTMAGFIGTVLAWKGVWDLCNVLIVFGKKNTKLNLKLDKLIFPCF